MFTVQVDRTCKTLAIRCCWPKHTNCKNPQSWKAPFNKTALGNQLKLDEKSWANAVHSVICLHRKIPLQKWNQQQRSVRINFNACVNDRLTWNSWRWRLWCSSTIMGWWLSPQTHKNN